MGTRSRFLSALLVIFLWAFIAAAQTRRGGVQPSSARDQAAALQNENVGGPFNSVCTAGTTFGSNVMANCDSFVLPHNETAITVDPNDPNHLAAGSNDTQTAAKRRQRQRAIGPGVLHQLRWRPDVAERGRPRGRVRTGFGSRAGLR